MYPFAVGWVWTDDASAPVSGPKLLPLLGVGVWFWAVLLRAVGVIALSGVLLALSTT